MALCWGFSCGFSSFLPYWYPVWMTIVILQRANRDINRCREKYGEVQSSNSRRLTLQDWKEYEKLCPYLFIPVHPTSTPSLTKSISGNSRREDFSVSNLANGKCRRKLIINFNLQRKYSTSAGQCLTLTLNSPTVLARSRRIHPIFIYRHSRSKPCRHLLKVGI